MLLALPSQAHSPDRSCDELALPGARSGVGTETLWGHLWRDEQQKTSNRGAGLRQPAAAHEVPHPGRRATDRR